MKPILRLFSCFFTAGITFLPSCKQREFNVNEENKTNSMTASELSFLPRAVAQDVNKWKWGCGPTDYLVRIKATARSQNEHDNFARALEAMQCAPGSATIMPRYTNSDPLKNDGMFFCCAIPVNTTMTENWKNHSEQLK